MPKRRHSNDEYEIISRKMKKLERKLDRARRRRRKSPQESTPCLDGPQGEVLVDDAIYEEETNEVECEQGSTKITINTNDLPHNSSTDNIPVVTNVPEEEGDNNSLDSGILEILGHDPTCNTEFGPDLHKEVAGRLEHLATCGLSRDQRKELQEKYPLPMNATKLGAPTLNSEIKAALPELLINRDKAIEAKQRLLGSAISCLGGTLSQLLGKKDKDSELISKIMDATRILCDVQHCDSITRRKFSCSSLKKDIKDQVQNTKIDKYLFGETLTETLRAAKAVSKSGAEIKTYNPNTAPKIKQKPNVSHAKNWKAPTARRPPAPQGRQENREPAYRPNQPYKHFKRSPHPSKQPRRR